MVISESPHKPGILLITGLSWHTTDAPKGGVGQPGVDTVSWAATPIMLQGKVFISGLQHFTTAMLIHSSMFQGQVLTVTSESCVTTPLMLQRKVLIIMYPDPDLAECQFSCVNTPLLL